MIYLHVFGELIKDVSNQKQISQYASDVILVLFAKIEEDNLRKNQPLIFPGDEANIPDQADGFNIESIIIMQFLTD